MKNKNIVIVLIVLVIVVVGAIYFIRQGKTPNASPVNTSSEQPQNKLETDDFSINLPDGWVKATSTKGLAAVAVKIGENINEPAVQKVNFKSYFAIIRDTLQEGGINEYLETLRYFLIESIPGTAFTKEQDTVINNRPAHLIEMEFTQDGVDFKILTALIKGQNNDVWTVSFNTPKIAWDEYKKMFYDTADSFSLKKQL